MIKSKLLETSLTTREESYRPFISNITWGLARYESVSDLPVSWPQGIFIMHSECIIYSMQGERYHYNPWEGKFPSPGMIYSLNIPAGAVPCNTRCLLQFLFERCPSEVCGETGKVNLSTLSFLSLNKKVCHLIDDLSWPYRDNLNYPLS